MLVYPLFFNTSYNNKIVDNLPYLNMSCCATFPELKTPQSNLYYYNFNLYYRRIPDAVDMGHGNTVKVEANTVEIDEHGVKVRLTVIDTPGFGDRLNNDHSFEPIMRYIDEQYNRWELRKSLWLYVFIYMLTFALFEWQLWVNDNLTYYNCTHDMKNSKYETMGLYCNYGTLLVKKN